MALPSQISYCKVTGRLIAATGDAADDPDLLPQGVGIAGATVRFRASVPRIRVASAPAVIFPIEVVCTTDADGYLFSPGATVDSETGLAAAEDRMVYLVAGDDPDLNPTGWTYTVTVSSNDIPATSDSFLASSGGEIDLASVITVPSSLGTALIEWQVAVNATGQNVILAQQAVTDAEAARDVAVEAAAHPSDPAVAALIDDAGSEVRAALSSTYATHSGVRVVIVGDSITDQCGLYDGDEDPGGAAATARYASMSGFWTWASVRLRHRLTLVRNAGVAGDTSTQTLARFNADVVAAAPDIVVIFVGINDFGTGIAAATTSANLQEMCERSIRAGARVILCTLLTRPTVESWPNLHAINQWIRRYARSVRGVHLCDWRSVYADAITELPTTGLATDSVHPHGVGASRLGKVLADVMTPLITESDDLVSTNGENCLVTLNPCFIGTGGSKGAAAITGTVADSWAANQGQLNPSTAATGTIVVAKTSRTSSNGSWQQAKLTSAGGLWLYQGVAAGSRWAVGDVVRAELEFERDDDWANARMMNLRLSAGLGSSVYAEDLSAGWPDSALTSWPMSGVLRTPPFTIPSGATGCNLGFYFSADAGTIRVGRAAIVKV